MLGAADAAKLGYRGTLVDPHPQLLRDAGQPPPVLAHVHPRAEGIDQATVKEVGSDLGAEFRSGDENGLVLDLIEGLVDAGQSIVVMGLEARLSLPVRLEFALDLFLDDQLLDEVDCGIVRKEDRFGGLKPIAFDRGAKVDYEARCAHASVATRGACHHAILLEEGDLGPLAGDGGGKPGKAGADNHGVGTLRDGPMGLGLERGRRVMPIRYGFHAPPLLQRRPLSGRLRSRRGTRPRDPALTWSATSSRVRADIWKSTSVPEQSNVMYFGRNTSADTERRLAMARYSASVSSRVK